MVIDEKDKTSGSDTQTGGASGAGGTTGSSNPGVKEEGTRLGTKTDIRGGKVEESEKESAPPEKMRDGTS